MERAAAGRYRHPRESGGPEPAPGAPALAGGLRGRRSEPLQPWIPAFAGMTNKRLKFGETFRSDGRDHAIVGAAYHGSLFVPNIAVTFYGWITVAARLMTKASCRSRKSSTTSTKASGRSAAMAWPAS